MAIQHRIEIMIPGPFPIQSTVNHTTSCRLMAKRSISCAMHWGVDIFKPWSRMTVRQAMHSDFGLQKSQTSKELPAMLEVFLKSF